MTPPPTSDPHSDNDIAVCGIGLRLPGGVNSVFDFWKLLIEGRDARKVFPEERYSTAGFDDSLGWTAPIKTKHGYLLENDLAELDTSFFNMTRAEAERCDPQQRQLLEVVRECFEDAGETNYRGQKIACYVGTSGEDWLRMGAYEPFHVGGYVMAGNSDLMIANRVSYEYDLRGASVVVKTGCSASLVALHEACNALRAGDARSALVAGTMLNLDPTTTALMTTEGILSPDGSCKTFSADANGFVRAEAINCLYIKPLKYAIVDGNPIRAVIRATASNSDGRSVTLMQPSRLAHTNLMRGVYANAGLDPAQTAYVELHGTGTPTGDPIETGAVADVFGKEGVYIGSVKANLGHSEASSGISSVVKAVLVLQNNTIPPQIKSTPLNPKIPFAENNLTVSTVAVPLPADRAARVSVNSFGIGGTNAHAIVEAYRDSAQENIAPPADDAVLLLHSANTAKSLQQAMDNYRSFVTERSQSLYDIGYTLAAHREALSHRGFSIVDKTGIVQVSGQGPTTSKTPELSLVFSGQGSQWAQMGQKLIEKDAGVREDLLKMDAILQGLAHPPTWSILEELARPKETTRINTAELAQPLCTALQIALVNRLFRLGIRPSAVVGHSSGEIAAAYAAGIVSLEGAVLLAYYRGLVTKTQSLVGGMAAVGLGATVVAPLLQDGLVVACENSPESCTISGDREKLEEASAIIKAQHPGALFRVLPVDMAYHSHHMLDLGAHYHKLLQAEFKSPVLDSRKARPTFYSSVSGDVVVDPSILQDPTYWETNLTSPVKFSSAVSRLSQDQQNAVFLEIGPHSTLAGPIRQILAAQSTAKPYVNIMKREDNSHVGFLRCLGGLFREGVELNFKALYPGGVCLQGLPLYPWDHSTKLWYESRLSKEVRHRKYAPHSLLGVKGMESTAINPFWRNVLFLEHEPWLADHRVGADVVFPFMGFLSMAGEAVRQLSDAPFTGYEVQKASVNTALVIPDVGEAKEVVTSLQRRTIPNLDDNYPWYDFTVSSWNGSGWTKHAQGRVRAIATTKKSASLVDREEFRRDVAKYRFYDGLKSVGLSYGREFQRLDNIRASADEKVRKAIASVMEPASDPTGRYTCNPATMDMAFQLLFVALSAGMPRRHRSLLVPTSVESITVRAHSGTLQAEAIVQGEYASSNIVELSSDGLSAVDMAGVVFKSLSTDAKDADVHAGGRIHWQPDFDLVDNGALIVPPGVPKDLRTRQEEMNLLCELESALIIKDLTPSQPHFARYREWLNLMVEQAEAGQIPLVPQSKEYARLSSGERRRLISDIATEFSTLDWPMIDCLKITYDNIGDIFSGKTDILELLTEDQLLTRTYSSVTFDYSQYIQALAHKKPNMRILEIGGGTGGATEGILRALNTGSSIPKYSLYTFTDVSAGFFPQARDRFSYAANVEYKVYDASKSPKDQGLDVASYDLVVAFNAIHTTESIRDTLKNAHDLLLPDGMLLICELCSDTKSPNYIFGCFPGWWMGVEDYRRWDPYISVEQWDTDLKATGFTGVEVSVLDQVVPYQLGGTIVSKVKPQRTVQPLDRKVALLTTPGSSPISAKLNGDLQTLGWDVTTFTLGSKLPEGRDIVSVLDLEAPFFKAIDKIAFTNFQELLKQLGKTKLLWLMPPAQIDCHNPDAASTLGALRTIRNELALDIFTLELEANDKDLSETTVKVFELVRLEASGSRLDPDKEFAVHNGKVHVGRYLPFSVEDEIKTFSAPDAASSKAVVSLEQPGLIDSLSWKNVGIEATLPADSVRVAVRAFGLNFRDVLIAMEIVEDGPFGYLGLELAGVVEEVGSEVSHLRKGDRVVAFATAGCMATKVSVPASAAVAIPDSLSFDEAATVPICFVTVWIAIVELARLCKGQSILIHSACGGVGLAALQLSRLFGLEVFATVGNAEKVRYLQKEFGLEKDRIFTSQDTSFVEGVLGKTNNKGVDLVLNSLSGELLHASWKAVAPYGKLVELGKRDLQSNGQLDMQPFLANRSYSALDLSSFVREKPEVVGQVLAIVLQHIEHKKLSPLPKNVFAATDIALAFRHLGQRDHIGKAVVSVDVTALHEVSTAAPQPAKFRSDASYLLTGGIGGLGRSIATWMVEHGARHLTILSRSAGRSSTSDALCQELEAMGCAVVTIAGKADSPVDVQRAIDQSPVPVRGVLHLAMVLRDSPFVDMSWDQWTDVIEPKVTGAWNLHHALRDQQLDFFWLASSVVDVFEQPGQGNYSAANTFLEAFAQYRHNLGLPASVLNICPISGVGFVAENDFAKKNAKAQGIYFLGESEFLEYLHLCLMRSSPSATHPQGWCNETQMVMGLRSEKHLDDPNNTTNWRQDRRMGYYHNSTIENATSLGGDDELKQFVLRANESTEAVTSDAGKLFLAKEVGKKIFEFMMVQDADQVDPKMTLSEIGLDSLMSIELRRWMRQVFGVEVSVLEILGSHSLEGLATVLAARYVEKLERS
ncbi:hypothetical protein NX059_009202 [Plenodomus lindquistii]|nr:hypothetical protein NX059_009202 [Plenodomus lindquistii]